MRRKAIGRADASTICDTAIKEQDNERDGSCGSCRLKQDDKRTEHLTVAENGQRRVLQGWRGSTVSRFEHVLDSLTICFLSFMMSHDEIEQCHFIFLPW